MSDSAQEPIYEPFKRRRRRGAAADCAVDATGQVIEYEHGYLRQQAKAARGVFPKRKGGGKKRPDLLFQVDEGCGVVIVYELELPGSLSLVDGALPIGVWWRNADGGALKPLIPSVETTVPTAGDQRVMKLLMPFCEALPGCRGNRFLVPSQTLTEIAGALAEVSQVRWSCRSVDGAWKLHTLKVPGDFSGGVPWNVDFRMEQGRWRVSLLLHGQTQDFGQEKWRMLTAGGCVIAGDELHALKLGRCFSLVSGFLRSPGMTLSSGEVKQAVAELTATAGAEITGLPDGLQSGIEIVRPAGRLYMSTARFKHLGMEQLQAELSFDYGGSICRAEMIADGKCPLRFAAADGSGRVIERSPDAEEELQQELRACGFRLVARRNGDEDPGWKLLPALLDGAVRRLVLSGWQITAEGKTYRRPLESAFSVSSFGIDWLEVKAEADFGDGLKADFPALLRAASRGAGCVRLDDGTVGILPNEWLERFTALVEIGESCDEGVRIRQQQALMLKGLLDEQLKDVDGRYGQVLLRLAECPAAEPSPAPPGFRAVLRPYQMLAVGWMRNLEVLGMGGILADDMGLGKTIEVLALLAWRHEARPESPSLVVVPSSLMFNWEHEIQVFAPRLSYAEYYGASRQLGEELLKNHDVIFTTYGTLRHDAAVLASVQFDYVILDEAQAIKNASSATAIAARVLKANHRIAMTGTPIENHLCELFSQLSFLNPGLFNRKFAESLGRENSIVASPEVTRRLRSIVMPFVLRRRKEQVVNDLPSKTEQVLWCELEGRQLELYEELKNYYRREFSPDAKLQPMADGREAGCANMLSALLRLRQTACAAELVNENCVGVPSAKLQMLGEKVQMLADGGHKVLVFSQFTKLLRLAADAVTAAGLKYSYLDGGTTDRPEQVRRFQEDPEVKVFLISLKAGGVGLNLTAADYVFILDPWWNPAAEAQAIDRAYRIGQTRPVFAYRMIARGTIEEKVLLMQERKRAIAAAALNGGSGMDAMPPGITAADLQVLLAEGGE